MTAAEPRCDCCGPVYVFCWMLGMAFGPLVAYIAVDHGDPFTAAMFALLALGGFLSTLLTVFSEVPRG